MVLWLDCMTFVSLRNLNSVAENRYQKGLWTHLSSFIIAFSLSFFIFCHGCVSKKSFLTRLLPRIISHHTGFSGLYGRKYHPKFSAVIAWNHRGVTILWETLDQITFVVFWAGSIRFLIARDLDENIARGLKILIGKHNGLNAIARLSFKKGVLKRYKIIQFLCNGPQGFQKLYP